jgi:hypothetical protein
MPHQLTRTSTPQNSSDRLLALDSPDYLSPSIEAIAEGE